MKAGDGTFALMDFWVKMPKNPIKKDWGVNFSSSFNNASLKQARKNQKHKREGAFHSRPF
jgi:hypothetical protein